LDLRSSAIKSVEKNFPSPHSELLLGMTVGADELKNVPLFKNALKTTGTIHVVVVSGFNIALVFGMVTKALGSQYKLKNMLIAQGVTLLYSLLTGFQPPVVRALLMGSVAAWGKYYGRLLDGLRILVFTACLMVLSSPSYLFSLSFQLSFLASLGLIVFGNVFAKFSLPEALSSTLSAQVMVWPLISNTFGQVSIIGLVANPLILWTVPIATILGGVYFGIVLIAPQLSVFISLLLYPFLDLFIRAVEWFGSLSLASISYQIGTFGLILYYIFLVPCVLYLGKVIKFKHEPEKS